MLERLRRKRTTESGSKQRLRAIKRAAPAKQGKGAAPQGQRKAIRGNRTRQRRT
jgi:hypothetical protein